jgi:restriction system protein
MIISINPKVKTQIVQQRPIPNSESPALKCSRSGSPMVLRTGKRGSFYGCSKFPKCRYTKDVW